MYLADHGPADHGSRVLTNSRLQAPLGVIPSHLIVLFTSSQGFNKRIRCFGIRLGYMYLADHGSADHVF